MASTLRLGRVLARVIVQFNGLIDRKSFDGYRFTCHPREEPTPGHMGWTLAYFGPKPVMALNCAGLKVDEVLARGRLKGLSCEAAKWKALRNPIKISALINTRNIEYSLLFGDW